MTKLDDDVEDLCASLRKRLSAAEVASGQLGGALWRVDVTPQNAQAAPVTVIASETEAILEAGKVFRMELPPLPLSHGRIEEVVTEIAAGHLRERFGGRRGRFELFLASGETLRGNSHGGVASTTRRTEQIEYAPY
jgi:hypothetical protein